MAPYSIALTAAVVFNATANLLLKVAARQLDRGDGLLAQGLPAAVKTALTCPALVLGLAFFALNVPLYFFALAKFKVSLAYPIMVGAGFAIIVTVASFSGLGERLSALQWTGVTFILLGVIIVCSTLNN